MKVKKDSSARFGPMNSSRWDKLKPWSQVQEEIEDSLCEPEKFDYSITLSHGPQLLHTMRHSNPIRCMTHYRTKKGEVFTTHGCHGSCSHVSVWTLESENGVSLRRFEMPTIYSHMVFVTKHRVYMTFCELDMTVRIFTEPKSSCKEVGCQLSLTRVLCLVYNKDEDEVIAGGRGGIDRWKVAGAEHAAKLKAGRKFNIHISKEEWIYEVKMDYKHKLFLALCDNGIYIISYQLNKQIGFLPNWHVGSLTCCCQYRNEYILTGSTDGTVMVWNGVVFNKVHEFQGHVDRITALHAHHQDPFVVSSSLDGTIYVWRMDSFQKFMRVDLGEKIFTMFLLGDEELFCQTEREINIFSLNQFFAIFAPVESSVFHLCRIQGHNEEASRILASTEDGSVRFFSPATGATVTICYPMPSFQVLTCFAYNNVEDKLFTVLTGGDVLTVNCKVNPCNAIEILKPQSTDEVVKCLLSLKVKFGVKEEIEDVLVLAGHKNGQISLLDSGLCCMMPCQAHKGSVSCLRVITELTDSQTMFEEFPTIFISGGSDYVLKFWEFFVDCRGHVFLNLVKQVDGFPTPVHLKVYHNIMAVVTDLKTRILQVFKLESKMDGTKDFTMVPYKHSIDYDHYNEITALDMSPVLQLFATASKDGLVKVWDSDNELVRELDFRYPIYGMCFANFRGDLVIGFQTNLVVVTIGNYLMYDQLEEVVEKQFLDDKREKPISYNHAAKPWFDPKTLPSYPTHLGLRRAAKTTDTILPESEHLLNVLEKIPSTVDLNDILITPTERALGDRSRPTSQARKVSNIRYGYARALNLTLAEDAQVEKIRRQSLKISTFKDHPFKQFSSVYRQSPSIAEETDGHLTSEDLLIETLIFHTDFSVTPESAGHKDSPESVKGIQELNDLIMELMPWERELLKKDPVIAPDGFIPNSVIRKKLNYVVEPPPSRSPWRLKSAPSHDPRFLPDGWADKIEEPDIIPKTTSLSSNTDKEKVSDKPVEKTQVKEVTKKIKLPEFEDAPVKSTKKTKAKKQKEKYKRVELKKFEFKRPNLDLDARKKKTQSIQEEEVTVSPTTMMETLQDTDETSAFTESAGSIKADPKDSIPESLLGLLNESWFPDCDLNTDSILMTLIKLLGSADPNLVSLASNFITGIYHLMGLSHTYGDLIVDFLLENLGSDNSGIVLTTLKTIRHLGISKTEVMAAVLPILLSNVPEVRAESMLLVNTLAGVNCKDGLRQLMVDLGIIKSLDACLTEKEALDILRQKLGLDQPVDETVRVTDWVESSVAGVYDNERKKVEKKTRQDSLIRRWSIKAKLKQTNAQGPNLPDVEQEEEEDLWMKLEVLRKNVNRGVLPLAEEESDLDVPPLPVIPVNESYQVQRPEVAGSLENVMSTPHVPNVSRVSGYTEEKEKIEASPLDEESTPEYYSTPSTISDDFTYGTPSLDNYSDMFSDDEPEQQSSVQFEIKDYREKSKVTVTVSETHNNRKKPVRNSFRPKIPKLLPDKKKNAKLTKQASRISKLSVAESAVKTKGPRRQTSVDIKIKDSIRVPQPSKRLQQYAQLAQCIEEDPDYIKKTLQEDSQDDKPHLGGIQRVRSAKYQKDLKSRVISGKRRNFIRYADNIMKARLMLKESGYLTEPMRRTTSINIESTCNPQSVLMKNEVLKKAHSDQIMEEKEVHDKKVAAQILSSLTESQRKEVDFTSEEEEMLNMRLKQRLERRLKAKDASQDLRLEQRSKVQEVSKDVGSKVQNASEDVALKSNVQEVPKDVGPDASHPTETTVQKDLAFDSVIKQDKDLLTKILKRQQIGMNSIKDREFVQICLQDPDKELQQMAQEYVKIIVQRRDSDTGEPYQDPRLELMLDHEDSGINDIQAGDSEARDVQVRQGRLHIDEELLRTELHHQDSGIARDMSDSSNFSHGTHPGAKGFLLKHESTLSPVKSCSHVGDVPAAPRSRHGSPDRDKKWQKNMVEREAGHVKSTLPPIRYLRDGPTVPGEAGLRLLHTVQFDKEKSVCERHRVQPMEGRLSYHTQGQRTGQTDFGALKLKWTTEIPVSTKGYNQYQQQTTVSTTQDPVQRLKGEGKDFVWDNPLPPAPPRGSRTLLASANKFHSQYCRDYQLAKKKLHHYTSEDIRKFTLPKIVNTRELLKKYNKSQKVGVPTQQHSFSNRQQELLKEFSKTDSRPPQSAVQKKLSQIRQNLSRHSALSINKSYLPPISLNHLIRNIKLKPIILQPES